MILNLVMNQIDISYELLAKYFSGECSPEELAQVEEWKETSEENERILEELACILSSASAKVSDIDACMEEVLDAMRLPKDTKRPGLKNRSRLPLATAVAASLALLFGLAFLTQNKDRARSRASEMTISTLLGQKSKLTLPDGTAIWLNSGTTISYSADYGIKDRKVSMLEGEAFFDVAPSKEHNFVIRADSFAVRVFGTKFSVCNYKDESHYSVVVQSGHVEVLDSDMKKVSEMHPGQRYLYDETTGIGTLSAYDAVDEGLWRFGELRITRETLPQVVRKMERWYGVHITLESYSSDLYWMTINTESLREMLDLINKIHPITYTINGSEVHITETNP